jgi:hypothetical protein
MRKAMLRKPGNTAKVLAISVSVACAAWSASAAHAQGTVVFTSGPVTVQRVDGTRVLAAVGMTVANGDTVITGADANIQMSMIDQARVSLRANSTLKIESYPRTADGREGAVLSLVRGTLRTFTGLLTAVNRDKFSMKTRTATVGIRGSGNILHACSGDECESDIRDGTNDVTVNYTIEGSHAVNGSNGQQLVTQPGQTVRATTTGLATIPTPNVIRTQGTQFSAKQGGATGDINTARGFAPPDGGTNNTPSNVIVVVGNNGIVNTGVNPNTIAATVGTDPLSLRDVVYAGGVVNSGQALTSEMTLEGAALRAYRAYAGLQSGLVPMVNSGTASNVQTVAINGTPVVMGRYDNASLSLLGPSGAGLAGSVHFIYATSAYPTFFSDVLTGTATYSLVGATSPTNQAGTAGTLTNGRLDVDFSRRLLSSTWVVAIPAGSGNEGGRWTMAATNVPITLNAFAASTQDRLVITNAAGVTSTANNRIAGSFSGSLVGTGLAGAIVGFSLSDLTNPANFNRVSGVAAFSGPAQDPNVDYRIGLANAPATATTVALVNRAADVTTQTDAIVGYLANVSGAGVTTVNRGSATSADVGFDPVTGLSWGRWSGGSATVGGQSVALGNSSVHTIMGAAQRGVTTLPLTGTAEYVAIGNTSPTDANGNVGRLNSANLNANFSNRTVSAGVNFTIANQTWNASANNMPIYRDLYFSAFAGLSTAPGLPTPTVLNITCTPNCGQNATGTLDGFFTGRNAQGAGVLYNINSITGTVAFRRPGA